MVSLICRSRGVRLSLEEAVSAAERVRGLIGRASIGPGTGMMFRAKQIHTFGMNFPIDVVYLDRAGTVLRAATMKARRVGPLVLRGHRVIELRAGEVERLGLQIGDRFEAENL